MISIWYFVKFVDFCKLYETILLFNLKSINELSFYKHSSKLQGLFYLDRNDKNDKYTDTRDKFHAYCYGLFGQKK